MKQSSAASLLAKAIREHSAVPVKMLKVGESDGIGGALYADTWLEAYGL